MRRRGSGILLHITSLPSEFGVGDLGPWAERFADFLAQSKQAVWQILPIGPTTGAIGNSPYSSFSAFAGNYLLVSPERLAEEGFLSESDIEPYRLPFGAVADYQAAERNKQSMLRKAFSYFKERLPTDPDFARFRKESKYWLEDYAMFMTLKNQYGGAIWNTWPENYRDRNREALDAFSVSHSDALLYEMFVQWIFFRQWRRLLKYCNANAISLVGDAPIYVLFDSADVWAHPEFYKLDERKQPIFVAGVPPDYFSETGQLWGNPVYAWDEMERDGFSWWVKRLGHNIELFNMIRIDHFRGFAGYWEVPAGERTAINGEWIDAPGIKLFDTLSARYPYLPVIAEDLGVITPDVRELRDMFGFPGMKIVQFAFGDNIATNVDALHNHVANSLAYTGTHDNNTARGWFKQETSPEDRRRLFAYLGREVDEFSVSWALIRLVMSSVAKLAIFPMQDLLSLDADARMNKPSVADGNWAWRLLPEHMKDDMKQALREATELFGRG
ncbi:4-alpha-glucanotransferase [Desulfocurvibacter africanus]|uniref:4-alpha-glucanotransferase n=1 Tax=Desulfocurvibacter africanus TaxID=873 RepID=UPI002FD94611